jgi:murein L,D-transpeptidase YcbB/YkuD
MKEIDPRTVDWDKINPENFPFQLRQDPGETNALGRVKFMFPNKFNVYLHDTPARALFWKPEREFSHGCIRIENPVELAEYVLRADPHWTPEAILRAMEESENGIVRLPKAVPVYVIYRTAWVDEDGRVQFRKDIYGRDGILENALAEKPQNP